MSENGDIDEDNDDLNEELSSDIPIAELNTFDNSKDSINIADFCNTVKSSTHHHQSPKT